MAYQPKQMDEQQESVVLFDENRFAVSPDAFTLLDEDKDLARLQLHYPPRAEIEEAEEETPDADALHAQAEAYALPVDEVIDTVGLYLKEMSTVPLLNMQQEVDLAKRIEAAKKARRLLNRLNGNTPLKKHAQYDATIEDGRLAREHLIKANTRRVGGI